MIASKNQQQTIILLRGAEMFAAPIYMGLGAASFHSKKVQSQSDSN